MIHTAHASLFHWGFEGTAENFARGEWLISHVYAILGLGESALLHAERCLRLAEENRLSPFDITFAHEALARSYAVSGSIEKAEEHKKLGLAAAEGINDEDEQKYAVSELNSILTL